MKKIKKYGDNYLKHEEKINDINRNKRNYILKSIYDKDIGFYKQILKLYIENKTEFRIRGRQKIMEISGKIYNESNIKTIQDKLNWLLIHENPESKTNLVDKILLHEYSKKKLGKDICVPILKVYNSSKEIDLNQLPDKFVLKCNHGSGMNILCSDKSKLNLMKAKIKLDEWVNLNYGLINFEFQYININRKIFAEYNLDRTLNDIETGLGSHFVRRPDVIFEKPKNLELMIKYARKLSSDFSFVRVDFYDLNDIVYLGEMTFSPSNMMFNCKDKNQSLYLGNLLDITKVEKN